MVKKPRSKPSSKKGKSTASIVESKQVALRSSSRYGLLKGLPLAHFLTPEMGDVGELANRSIEELCSIDGVMLRALEERDQRAFTLIETILSKLAEDCVPLGEEPLQGGASLLPFCCADFPQARAPIVGQTDKHPFLNSVQAEELLTEAIGKLANSSKFPLIAQNNLGAFWDPVFGSAPFEESITFRQLSELSAVTLLEKKSFGQRKIRGVLAAVERALASLPADDLAQLNSSIDELQGPAIVTNAGLIVPAAWMESHSDLPISGRALLRYYSFQMSVSRSANSPIARLIRKIPSCIAGKEFLVLWFMVDYSADIVAQILRFDRTDLVTAHSKICNRLNGLLQDEANELRSYWDIALRSPGISLQKLGEVFGEPLLDPEFFEAFVRLLLLSMGAQNPIAFGVDFSEYWTKNPNTLQMSIGSIVSTLPKSKEAVIDDFAAMFPFIDPNILELVLSKQAAFDEAENLWKQRR